MGNPGKGKMCPVIESLKESLRITNEENPISPEEPREDS